MKRLKKIFSAVLIITLFCIQIFAAKVSADVTYSFAYTITDTNATITGFAMAPTAACPVIIPDTITDGANTYTVTAIGNAAFKNNTFISSVILPDTITTIGEEVFYGCANLTTANIPGSAISIAKSMFRQSGIRTLVVGEGVTSIPTMMFYNCYYLSSLILPNSVNYVDAGAFTQCRRLESFTILADNIAIKGTFPVSTGTTFMGSEIVGGTKFYAANETVKSIVVNAGIKTENAEVFDSYLAFLYPENGIDSVIKVVVDKNNSIISLPSASREGYVFEGWYDGTDFYESESEYNITKNKVFVAKWRYDTEPANVLYRNISKKSQINSFDSLYPVRRIICEELSGQTIAIVLSDELGVEKNIIAKFSKNGIWINYDDENQYSSVIMPIGYDYSNLTILTNADESNFRVDIPIKTSTTIIYPRIEGHTDLSEFEWATSDITVAKVINGIVFGYKSGTATIIARYNNISFSVTVRIVGEIANAEDNGTIEQYLKSKKPIIDEINRAISAYDNAALKAVLTSSGSIKLSDILDIDTTEFESLSESDLSKLANRIITYGRFECLAVSDILMLNDTLIKEIRVGDLDSLTDIDDIENVLITNNAYYGLLLENEYYLKYKEDILASFINYSPENLAAIKSKFVESYVITAYKEAAGWTTVQTVVNDCANEIGYDAVNYKNINNSYLHKALMSAKSSIKNLSDLKLFIDGFTPPRTGGSTGSGGSGASNSKIVMNVDSITAATKVEEIPKKTSVFIDVPLERWSYSAIQYLVAKKVISGYEDGNFYPEKNITRGEFVKLLVETLNIRKTEEVETGNNGDVISFNDVAENDWDYDYIITASQNKFIFGDSNNNFNPNNYISRQEMASILYRAVVMNKVTDINTGENRDLFVDQKEIEDWAYLAVMQLHKMGLINGHEDGYFRPNDKATREAAATIISNYALEFLKSGEDK